MYFKLSLRNAKRSMGDYFLYIAAMVTLLAIMQVSECLAVMGKMQAGFQTASLPILIVIILVILVDYVDHFMFRRRAKEFANYLLLGMEKAKLSKLFLYEFFLIGIICFVAGAAIGLCIYAVSGITIWHREAGTCLTDWGRSLLHTFFYFYIAEGLSAFRIKEKIGRLQIRELMHEKERSQRMIPYGSLKIWGWGLTAGLVCFIGMMCGIVFLPADNGTFMISFIAIPMLGTIFMFYGFLFRFLHHVRQKQENFLYQKNRIYMIAQMTSGSKAGIVLNSVFCICILFAVGAFVFGVVMLCPDVKIFDGENQQWMGIMQICICIIFIVVYFSSLSLKQVIDLKQELKNIRVVHYMGKSNREIKRLIKGEIAIRLLMPVFMTFLILLCSTPLLNLKMNQTLPNAMHNILLKSVSGFTICFLVFYGFYFLLLYRMIMHSKTAQEPHITTFNARHYRSHKISILI